MASDALDEVSLPEAKLVIVDMQSQLSHCLLSAFTVTACLNHLQISPLSSYKCLSLTNTSCCENTSGECILGALIRALKSTSLIQHCNRGDLFILPVLLWMQFDMISSASQFGCNFWASLIFISLTAASSGNTPYFSTYFSSASPTNRI